MRRGSSTGAAAMIQRVGFGARVDLLATFFFDWLGCSPTPRLPCHWHVHRRATRQASNLRAHFTAAALPESPDFTCTSAADSLTESKRSHHLPHDVIFCSHHTTASSCTHCVVSEFMSLGSVPVFVLCHWQCRRLRPRHKRTRAQSDMSLPIQLDWSSE